MTGDALVLSHAAADGPGVLVSGPAAAEVAGYLSPFFVPGGPGTPVAARIEVGAAGDCAEPPPDGGGSPVRLHGNGRGSIVTLGTTALVTHLGLGVHYHVDPANQYVRICLPGHPSHVLDAVQVVRGAVLGVLLGAGHARVHGAAFSRDGRGILLTGEKGAGKTSYLLAGVAAGEAVMVTNDKLLLTPGGLVLGLPYAVAVAPGTLSQLPELHGCAGRWVDGKLLVWPRDMAAALGSRLLTSVPLDEVWHCALDLDRGFAVRTASPDDVRAGAVAAGRFSDVMTPRWLYDLLGWHPAPSPPALAGCRWRTVSGNPWLRSDGRCLA